MKGTKLTERQRMFATEHHNVPEGFLVYQKMRTGI